MLQSNFLQECTQFCEKAENPASIEPARFSLCFHGPSDRSRTCGLLNPIQARYQSALHPDLCVCTFTALCYINTSKFQMQDVFAGKTKKSLKIPNNKASQNKVPDICAGTKEVRCIFVHAAHFQTVKKPRRVSCPQARNKFKSFFAAACTAHKNTSRIASVEWPP